MALITDGGSTKCDWVLLDAFGKIQFKTTTKGLNPTVLSKTELSIRISENPTLKSVFDKVKILDFYGAGCSTAVPTSDLRDVLQTLFSTAQVSVREDTAAAVFAVTTEPGIVCILGTGSNSCYFDGSEIHTPIPALGYVLMDEASGNHYGRRLIRDYFYKIMPTHLAAEFERQFNLDADDIKTNLYKKANPNAYLASFAKFMFRPEISNDIYFQDVIKEGMSEFIKNRILTFENAKEVPIHFIGSIAYCSRETIQKCLEENNLQLGNFVKRPIDGLIDYYRRNI